MDKVGVQAALAAAGLSRLVKGIDLIAQPSIRLSATPVDESALSIGASKLGGIPDLPPGIGWPEWKGLPQSFIAQIRLEDIRQHDPEGVLPRQGMLWFFYDAQQQTFGVDPADRGGWCVIFVGGDLDNPRRTPAPARLPDSSRFHACTLSFVQEITLAQQPQLEIPGLGWSEVEQEKYEQLLATFPDPGDRATIHHRLLGNPDIIQDDMRLECQLASHGITDMDDPRVARLAEGAKDWRLLLQVDSDEHAGMRWASNGMLYFWIKGAELQASHFDDTWVVLQSE